MALRASYYGLKKRILDKVLSDYDSAGVMTNKELTDWISEFFFATGNYTGDMNDITNGFHYVSNAAAHNPVSNWGFSITMTVGNADNRVQLFFPLFLDGIFSRRRDGNGWKDWKSATLSAI